MSTEFMTQRITPAALIVPAPSRAQLEAAIVAAQAAPDHGRLGPWQFLIIEGDALRKLGKVMAEALHQRDPQVGPLQLQSEAEKPLRAPVLVVIACNVQENARIPELEQVMAVSAATQNFQLAIHSMGFGCQWKTGPAARDGYVKAMLGLHPADHIIGFMYVGTIATPGKPRPAELDRSKVRDWV